jgi:hypothetical protein
MRHAPITCRQCGASTARQDEFTVVERRHVDATQITEYGDDGSWWLEGLDQSPAGFNITTEIQCECSHAWTSTREYPRSYTDHG